MLKTKSILAAILGITGAYPTTLRRTVKVRPPYPTMLTSSDDEIRLHNAAVVMSKKERTGRRVHERSKLIGNGMILQLVPARHRNRGNTAYLNRAYKRAAVGV